MTHSRRVLAGVLVALALSGCGNTDGDAEPDAAASPSTSPSTSTSASPSSSPTAEESPYVPGDPQNEVRPATAQELADWPVCDEVWRGNGRIPARYRGCVDGDDAVVADRIECSFGGSMTTYGRYYGVIGNVVNDAGRSLERSKAYLEDYQLCTG